jgi:hypothetical protein
MNWFMSSAAIGSGLDIAIGSAAGALAVVACAPAWLAARDALRRWRASMERPRMRVLDGRRSVPRRPTWVIPRVRRPVRT